MLTVGRPALQSLNSTLPGIRRFAVDARPGVESSGPTIEATFPFIRQLRGLFSPAELRGLVDDLRPTIPALARLNDRTVPLLQQNRALASCQNNVVLDFADDIVPNVAQPGDPVPAGTPDFPANDPDESALEQPFYKLGPRSFLGLAGESRTYDANGKAFRVQFGLENATTFFRTPPKILGDSFVDLQRS